jgi:hypothetical protein
MVSLPDFRASARSVQNQKSRETAKTEEDTGYQDVPNGFRRRRWEVDGQKMFWQKMS